MAFSPAELTSADNGQSECVLALLSMFTDGVRMVLLQLPCFGPW